MSNKFDEIISETSSLTQDCFFGDIPTTTPETSRNSTTSPTLEKQTEKIFSVSEFSILLKSVLEGAFSHIKIKGEIHLKKKI